MRRLSILLILCALLCGCAQEKAPAAGIPLTDALGNTHNLSPDATVVGGYASFADMWLLSGGSLAGVTEDAIGEHQLDVPGDIPIIGTVKHIDLERLTALNPDYVLLSADLTAHLALKESLDALAIPYGYFRVDTFEDYKTLMAQFCRITSREDLFAKNVLAVEEEIARILGKIPETDRTFLLLRAYSTGMKAKGDDNLAGQILKEFGLKNIADSRSLLEDLSLEYIVQADPDYLFASTMGSEEGALAYFQETVQNNPAWAGLTAVQSGSCHLLPRELFHYKPNERWSESYAYLARLIWPEIF